MRNLLNAICLLLVSVVFHPCMAQKTVTGEDLVLMGAKIYPAPDLPPVNDGVVVIRKGKIVAAGNRQNTQIPKGIKVLDCKGLVVTAGFWNSHVHLIEPKWNHADTLPVAQLNAQLSEMLISRGFTHVFDLASLNAGNLFALRDRINKGEVAGPAILAVGVPFAPPDGSPFYIAPLKLPEIGDPQEAARYVTKQIKAGADGIKIWSASPDGHKVVPMPVAVVKAAVAAAHKLGKPVFAHPTSDTGRIIAVENGVDVLAHVAPDEHTEWSKQNIDQMLTHHIALIPTLKLYHWELKRSNMNMDSSVLMTSVLQQLGAYSRAGGTILFGTDVGYIDDYSTTEEFELMAKAGLSFKQILTSLTTAPATKFGHAKHSGRIAPGMDADLVVLGGDPGKNAADFSDVVYTIRNGKILYNR